MSCHWSYRKLSRIHSYNIFIWNMTQTDLHILSAIWDVTQTDPRLFPVAQILDLLKDCSFSTCGDAVEWADFRAGTRGAMKIRWPSDIQIGGIVDMASGAYFTNILTEIMAWITNSIHKWDFWHASQWRRRKFDSKINEWQSYWRRREDTRDPLRTMGQNHVTIGVCVMLQ